VSFTPPFAGSTGAVLLLEQQSAAGTSTPVPPTNTPLPPTNTPLPPTNTPLPPTNTPLPPTNTPLPPTNTPVRPTNTPLPPTNTPTATSAVSGTPTPAASSTATPVFTQTATALPPSGTPTGTPGGPTATTTVTSTPTVTREPFPSSPLLDNFNRPDGPIGVNWGGEPQEFRILNNRLSLPAAGVSLWRPQSFGPDQEAFLTLSAVSPVGAANEELGVVLKAAVENGVLVRAIKVVYVSSSAELHISAYDEAGGWRQVGNPLLAAFQSGDRLGVHAHSNGMVEVFRNDLQIGAFAMGADLGTAGGFIGIAFVNADHTAALIDNFGGGDTTGNLPPPYVVTVQALTVGQGSVVVTPTGVISCGQLVTITAQPAAGFVFVGWTGDVVANANPLVYRLYGSLIVEAHFVPEEQAPEYTVDVSAQDGGIVAVQPVGPYYPGQVVEMTAIADNDWRFDGWIGSVESRDNPLRVQVTTNLVATAAFVRATNLYLPQVARLESTNTLTGTMEICQ
jgi:hypothetical protein